MRLKRPVNHSEAGFTLIELVVVLILIAILSAAIVSEMSGTLQDTLLRGSSRQLIDVFSLASSRAISVNRLHRVRFDRNGGHYVIEQHARGDDFVPAHGIPESEGSIDSRIALRVQDPDTDEQSEPQQETTSANAVNFYPDGTSDGRAIELRDRDGNGLALRVNAITARVEIVELPHQ